MRNREVSFIYLVLSGASSLCYSMILTVELVYLIQTVGFNPLQLVLIGTVSSRFFMTLLNRYN